MAHHPGRALLDSRNSPLAKAVQSLDVARLRELLAGGVDANTRIGPKSALHELCSTPDVAPLENYEPPRATIVYYRRECQRRAACVAALLDKGADPNLRPSGGSKFYAPLLGAATRGFPDIVRLLLAHGADVGFTQSHGTTVLHAVIMTRLANVLACDHAECVRLLIAGGADLHATRLNEGRPGFGLPDGVSAPTPFDDALYYNRPHLFPILLRAGASCTIGFSTNVRRPGPFLEGRLGATSLSCFPYFIKVHAAGGIKAYEKAHLKRLVAMLVHKFPQLPAAVHPNIVRHWAHVGDY